MLCKKKVMPENSLFEVFDTLNIEKHKKVVLQDRYLQVLSNFNTRSRKLSFAFYSARVIVTVGSILVPAFLSIQETSTGKYLYWTTWLISVAVSISNGFITLFKLDKKYYFINTTLEMLHSEGWQYVGLTGRYAPKDATVVPTHENQFSVFFKMAERIKMRQVEEEYWKFTDTSGVGNATNHHPLLISATPMTQQGELATLPQEKRTIIEGWLEDMKNSPKIGLQPRMESDFYSSRRIFTESRVDEGDGSPRVSGTPSNPSMSMRQTMQDTPSSKPPTLQLSSIGEEIQEDTIVQIVSDESSVRK
jgi:hypothetical protein